MYATGEELRSKALNLLRASGDPQPHFDDHWVTRFLRRNADLSSKVTRGVDNERVAVMTSSVVHQYFDVLRGGRPDRRPNERRLEYGREGVFPGGCAGAECSFNRSRTREVADTETAWKSGMGDVR